MFKGISIVSMLLNYVNYSDSRGSDYDVAKGLLENYHDIPDLTIYDLADRCFVSASTLTRFIRNMGFESFKLFKQEVKESIHINVDYSKQVQLATGDDLQPIFKRYTDNVIENLRFTYEHLDYEQLARIGEMIYEAKQIAFFGLEYANYAGIHFQNKMAAFDRFVQIGSSDEKQIELAQRLDESSLALIVTLEGGFFYHHDDIMKILKEKHCKIVAMTMMTFGKALRDCDEVVLMNKTNSSTEGRITIMYMIELLIMYYYINYSHSKNFRK